VAAAFLMGPEAVAGGWDSAVALVQRGGARRAVVVPLLVSSFGSHYRQVRYYAGELPTLPEALADQGRTVDGGWRRGPTVPIAHGPEGEEDAARWTANLERVAARIVPGALNPSTHLARWIERVDEGTLRLVR
jgi:hypothetical protein